jgi:dTDP-4-dehydrorhamnose reductase
MLSKYAMIVGGNGCLGRAIINQFKLKNWKTLNLDHTPND